jgi:hypothetical protein
MLRTAWWTLVNCPLPSAATVMSGRNRPSSTAAAADDASSVSRTPTVA